VLLGIKQTWRLHCEMSAFESQSGHPAMVRKRGFA
jgi:hypothetical protein